MASTGVVHCKCCIQIVLIYMYLVNTKEFEDQRHDNNSRYEILLKKAACQAKCYKMYGTSNNQENRDLYLNPFANRSCYSSPCKKCLNFCEKIAEENRNCSNICINEDGECAGICRELVHIQLTYSKVMLHNLTMSMCQYNTQPSRSMDSFSHSNLFMTWVTTKEVNISGKSIAFVISIKSKTPSTSITSRWIAKNTTVSDNMTLRRLATDQDYNLRLTPVSEEGLVYLPIISSKWLKTHSGNRKSANPVNLKMKKQILRHRTVSALIAWNQGEDSPCFYKMFWMTTCGPLSMIEDYKVRELKFFSKSSYWIHDLKFGCNYTVKLQSYGGPTFTAGSNTMSTSFITMNCLVATNYSYNICAPEPVRDVVLDESVTYIVNETTFGNITISWIPPTYTSDKNRIQQYVIVWIKGGPFYNLQFLKPHRDKAIVPGNTTYLQIADIHWHNTYSISIKAISEGGESKPFERKFDFGMDFENLSRTKMDEIPAIKPHSRSKSNLSYVVGITVTAATALCVVLIFCAIKKTKKCNSSIHGRGNREEEFNPLYHYHDSSSPCTEPLVYDEYEIATSRITLYDVIGEGAFGKVHKAELLMNNGRKTTVAIKMLKGLADHYEERSLMAEIEAMKQLGQHPNIVSMLGYCTKGPVLFLVMDYCPLGDLRNFLLKCRQKSAAHVVGKMKRDTDSGISQATQSGNGESSYESGNVNGSDAPDTRYTFALLDSATTSQSHPSVLLSSTTASEEEEEICLQEETLLSYARQISIGMEYLSQRKFVHRDLATRNILLTDQRRLKISDFGLTRDVYETNMYQPTSARKLPYKWMALESIHDQLFTIKSDVWSFGIVLWEIVTLGGCPYPGIPNEDLFRLLKDGYRMEKPENCSPEIYQMMLSTWHPAPDCRPSFTDLRSKLESMLETTKSYINLCVSVSQDYYQSETSSADNGSGMDDNKEDKYKDIPRPLEMKAEVNLCAEIPESIANSVCKSETEITPICGYNEVCTDHKHCSLRAELTECKMCQPLSTSGCSTNKTYS